MAQHGPSAIGVPVQGQVLTSKLLICETFLVGEEEGEEPIQASWGSSGHNVEEDGSVEDLEDGGWVGSRTLPARCLLPAGEPPALGTGAAASVSHLCNELGAAQLPAKCTGIPTRGHPWGRLPTHSSPVLPVSPTKASRHLDSSCLGAAVFWAPAMPPGRDSTRVQPRASTAGKVRPVGAVGDRGMGWGQPACVGNRGHRDSSCPSWDLWGWGHMGHPSPPTHLPP